MRDGTLYPATARVGKRKIAAPHQETHSTVPATRTVEVVTAGCPLCDDVIDRGCGLACGSCDVRPVPECSAHQVRAAAPRTEQAGGASTAAPASFRQTVVNVEGRNCTACPTTVQTALEGIDGAHSVRATYKPPEAVVRFDPALVTVEDLTRATSEAGYPSQTKSSS